MLDDLRREGKIELIGLSEVTVDELTQARLLTSIASVQNLYNVVNRQSEAVLEYCEREGLGLRFNPGSWVAFRTGHLPSSLGRG